MAEMVTDFAPLMNRRNGTYSCSRNSFHQRQFMALVKEKVNEMIAMKLDVKSLCSASNNTFILVDLGCSVGPNTLIAIQNLIEVIKLKHRLQSPTSEMPEFQVCFNDQVLNDFNTLFTSLPQERQYFAAGVPVSFHNRLFPKSSIHFAYSSAALHCLSKAPEEMPYKNSPAWNKGRIHYTSGPDEVLKAYSSQFAEEIENFLKARAKEMVAGGMMVMIVQGIRDGVPHSQITSCLVCNCITSSLMDMVEVGLINEDQLDSFNLPYYISSPEEMK